MTLLVVIQEPCKQTPFVMMGDHVADYEDMSNLNNMWFAVIVSRTTLWNVSLHILMVAIYGVPAHFDDIREREREREILSIFIVFPLPGKRFC